LWDELWVGLVHDKRSLVKRELVVRLVQGDGVSIIRFVRALVRATGHVANNLIKDERFFGAAKGHRENHCRVTGSCLNEKGPQPMRV
jgi:hypothetical protein